MKLYCVFYRFCFSYPVATVVTQFCRRFLLLLLIKVYCCFGIFIDNIACDVSCLYVGCKNASDAGFIISCRCCICLCRLFLLLSAASARRAQLLGLVVVVVVGGVVVVVVADVVVVVMDVLWLWWWFVMLLL